jgi:SAM-dependent methyltransferase
MRAVKSLLSLPYLYDAFQFVARGTAYQRRLASTYIRARAGDRVLDLGCGTGVMLACLPHVEYVGIDMSQAYIDACRRRHGGRGSFHCALLTADTVGSFADFDVILAVGVIHHLDDNTAAELFRTARDALRPGGRLVTLDGVFTAEQSRLKRALLEADRGRHVRSAEAYRELAAAGFDDVQATVVEDLFRIPYSNLIMECSR